MDERARATKPNALKHLDEASTSIALNIAAACLDVLVARNHLSPLDMQPGKERLLRIVSMLTKLIERLLSSS